MKTRQRPQSADAPPWGVMRCDCGTFRLRLGAVQLELDAEDLLRLEQLLASAVEHFGLTQPSAAGRPH